MRFLCVRLSRFFYHLGVVCDDIGWTTGYLWCMNRSFCIGKPVGEWVLDPEWHPEVAEIEAKQTLGL